jgi:hypothetical protein
LYRLTRHANSVLKLRKTTFCPSCFASAEHDEQKVAKFSHVRYKSVSSALMSVDMANLSSLKERVREVHLHEPNEHLKNITQGILQKPR